MLSKWNTFLCCESLLFFLKNFASNSLVGKFSGIPIRRTRDSVSHPATDYFERVS